MTQRSRYLRSRGVQVCDVGDKCDRTDINLCSLKVGPSVPKHYFTEARVIKMKVLRSNPSREDWSLLFLYMRRSGQDLKFTEGGFLTPGLRPGNMGLGTRRVASSCRHSHND